MNIRKDKTDFMNNLNNIRTSLPKQYGTIIKHKFKDVNISRVRNVKNHGTPLDWKVLKMLADVAEYELIVPDCAIV